MSADLDINSYRPQKDGELYILTIAPRVDKDPYNPNSLLMLLRNNMGTIVDKSIMPKIGYQRFPSLDTIAREYPSQGKVALNKDGSPIINTFAYIKPRSGLLFKYTPTGSQVNDSKDQIMFFSRNGVINFKAPTAKLVNEMADQYEKIIIDTISSEITKLKNSGNTGGKKSRKTRKHRSRKVKKTRKH